MNYQFCGHLERNAKHVSVLLLPVAVKWNFDIDGYDDNLAAGIAYCKVNDFIITKGWSS